MQNRSVLIASAIMKIIGMGSVCFGLWSLTLLLNPMLYLYGYSISLIMVGIRTLFIARKILKEDLKT